MAIDDASLAGQVQGESSTNGVDGHGANSPQHDVTGGDRAFHNSINGTSNCLNHTRHGVQSAPHRTGDVPNHKASAAIHTPPAPIAICGMACRLPGGLSSPEEAWNFICAKKDGRIRVPESRYNVSSYYDKGTARPATVKTEYGYFLDDSVDLGALDTTIFPIPRAEVERVDPQQRLMLEIGRECFEDAGVTDWRGKTIGCYVGSFGEDWAEMCAKEPQQYGLYRVLGVGDFGLSNRLSYEFDINGPSMTIRTGCSAALVALNEACAAIGRGDCEAALVGGVNLIMGPGMTTAMTEQGVLSKDGESKSFSADANGYARGEAITAVYIKPLADAIRDGNPVRAVIRATSHNSDGRTPGISQPSTDAHEALMRRAYDLAGINDFGETAMVECHGTGTPIGDPIEAKAVARVFGEKGVYIGSVKPNLGHTEGASGLVSVIKMVKALEHRTIPPNIKFNTPNPNIPFEEAKLVVPLDPTPWPDDRKERVSLNSFGVGGANAHVILESAASHGVSKAIGEIAETPQLLLLTANTTNSMDRLIEQYKAWVDKNPEMTTDLAYTLARRRQHLRQRAFAIVKHGSIESVSPVMDVKPSAKPPNLVMVFTGQGAQWPQMGNALLQSNEVFRSSIRQLDEYLRGVAEYSVEKELKKPTKTSRLSSAELSQPLCTALQIALVDALKAVGISPDAVVGHSSGELAGAYASGALTAKEAIIAAHLRGAVAMRQKKEGRMAAIGMSWEDIEKHLIPNVRVACDNSPKSVTISGDADAVKAVVADIQQTKPEVLARLLQVDKAYHSHHMAEVGDEYLASMSNSVHGSSPQKHFFSSVYGKLVGAETSFGPKYWVKNLESPVRFNKAVTDILNHDIGKNAVFLEVGPHSALSGPLRQIFSRAQSPAPYVSALNRGQDCMTSFLTAIGKLHSLNVSIDLAALFPSGSCLPDLPRYPWDHKESHWYEARASKEWRLPKFPLHDLLGRKTPESSELEPVFRNLLHLSNVPWVRDHKLGEDTVFPFAAYIGLAGEAVRQITGIADGFSIRNIVVSTAFVLTEGKPMEMVSTFRPQRLTNSLNSTWWDFTVSSYNGHQWIKHCSGEVSAIEGSPAAADDPQALPRKVSARKWYETMQKGGLDLGPCFQTLEAVETSTGNTNRAIGHIVNGRQGDEANYHIHPTVIDGTIQILSAAAVHGLARKMKTWLPVSMEQISLWRCEANMVTDVSATLSSNQSVVGSGRCTSNGAVIIEATGIKMSLADGTLGSNGAETHAAARYEWAPDIEFMSFQDLVRPPKDREGVLDLLDELGQLCLLHSKRRCGSFETESSKPHLAKYLDWIKARSHLVVGSLAARYPSLDDETILARVDAIVSRLTGTQAASVAQAIQRVCMSMDELLAGKNLSYIISDQLRTNLNEFVQPSNRQNFIRRLSHCHPNMRVLELGTGKSSSPSHDVVSGLKHANGTVLCSKYTLTSPGYISTEGQDKEFPKLEAMTFDLNEDPENQGLAGRQYDLIIASNALHSSNDIQQSLGYLKKLLSAGGRLLLQELCPSSWVTYVFGLETAWWASGRATGHGTEPVFNFEEWESHLIAAGLGSIDGKVFDAQEEHVLSVTLAARHTSSESQSGRKITALCEEPGSISKDILARLEELGFQVTTCSLQEVPVAGQDVVSLLDIEKPFFADITRARYEALQAFVQRLDRAGIIWATQSCDVGCRDPRYAEIIGLARVIRSEQGIEMAVCQVDDFCDMQSIDRLCQVVTRFQTRTGDELLDPDYEWNVREGQVQIGRFYPFELLDELLESEQKACARLDVAIPGRVNSLHWIQQSPEELKPGEVEVQVHAAGLNFRDVLVALGIVELPVRQFGLEAAGHVTRVASDVRPDELKVGDRVFCVKRQAYSTYLNIPSVFCVRIPDKLSFEDAGAMLIPYVTALHSLVNVGHLEKGQNVLIHSACGGVGLAAVQICQRIGAELFVTVGNEEKVNFLMENFQIPRNRIFDSRSNSFVEGIKRETQGKGMDVVLNSLSGELLHATWTCVAEFGTLVEIGKRDLIGKGKLDLEPFLKNRSYCCVDIDQLPQKKPQLLRKLILETLEYPPIRPNRVFPASQTQDAFRFMQKGQHIGRVCISIPHGTAADIYDRELTTTQVARPIAFDSSASYVLVGGLGGLGRAISAWMVEHGARELIFFSRSAGKTVKDDIFVAELQSMGCNVKLIAGDVTKLEDVKNAVKAATLPVKGVVQMSMVLRDQNFKNMSFEDWQAVSTPKVQGTWNLHHATANAKLDFFVLFSSLSGVIGQPGQASYASANTFLDAFAQYRNGKGLAASVVDIGAVEEVGYISENQGMMNTMKATGFKGLSEQELLDAMAVAMLCHPGGNPADTNRPSKGTSFINPTSFVLGLGSSIPLTSSSNRAVWKRDRRMAAYHNVANDEASAGVSAETLKSYLVQVKADPALLKSEETWKLFAVEIGKKLYDMLLKPHDELNTSLPMTDLGLDSLVALELRAWWKQVFAFDITVLEMLGMGSLNALGRHAADELYKIASEGVASG